MSTNVNWPNPYENREGQWLRGNLHTHTSPASECASVSKERAIELYTEAGYDFLAITDHMAVTSFEAPGMTRIPAIEWNASDRTADHTCIYALDEDLLRLSLEFTDHDKLLQRLATEDVLVVLNHPNWSLAGHYRRTELAEKPPFDGVEIYNNIITILPGCALATDKWDYLLATGRRALGFASDDSHHEEGVGGAWICVRSASPSPADILAAVRHGNFYCSTGVVVTDVRRSDNVMEIETENAQEIHVVGNGGELLKRVTGNTATLTIPDDLPAHVPSTAYVRFAAYGPGAAMAWTQPFFCDGEDERGDP